MTLLYNLYNTFEGSTSGTTISTSNSGGASGDLFDTVNIGTSATLTFDNTHAVHGSLAASVSTPSVAASSYVLWSSGSLGGSPTQIWFRVYLYFTANPAHTFTVVQSGGLIQITTAGKLFAKDSASGTLSGTATIPLNQWFRVEGFMTASATVGQIEMKLFKTADSTTADETDTSPASLNVSTNSSVRFGVTGAFASIGPFWMDDLGVSTTGYLGPAPSANPAVLLFNSAEGGSNGTTATGGSAGNTNAASGNYFDIIASGTGSAITFDNTHAAHGTLSYKLAPGAGAVTCNLSWTSSLAASGQTRVDFRVYAYLPSTPTANTRLITVTTTAGTKCAALVVNTTGKMSWQDTTGAQITGGAFTNACATAQWIRVEGYVIGSATVGQVSASLYNSMDSTTATETVTSAASQNTAGLCGKVLAGPNADTASVPAFWVDDFAATTSGTPLGPALVTITGVVATAAEAAPAGTTVVSVPGVAATIASAGPSDEAVSGTVIGVIATGTSAAPSDGTTAVSVPGVAASLASAAPAGGVSMVTTGIVAAGTTAAPSDGGITGTAVVSGAVATITAPAPAGGVSSAVTGAVAPAVAVAPPGNLVMGPVATITTAVPSGEGISSAVTGVESDITANAIAGTVTGTGVVSGVTTQITSVSTGAISGAVSGQPAMETSAAPAGGISVSLTGVTCAASASAPAGTTGVSLAAVAYGYTYGGTYSGAFIVTTTAPPGAVSTAEPEITPAQITSTAPPGGISVTFTGTVATSGSVTAPAGSLMVSSVVRGAASIAVVAVVPGAITMRVPGMPAVIVAIAVPGYIPRDLIVTAVNTSSDISGRLETPRVTASLS
jgi:hypothetical protein